jgi:hypothetical protein
MQQLKPTAREDCIWKFGAVSSVHSTIGQLNGIAVRVFAIAKTEHTALPDLAEAGAARYQLFTQSCDIFGMKHDFRTLAARR